LDGEERLWTATAPFARLQRHLDEESAHSDAARAVWTKRAAF
jgi:hypothetical protein